MVVRTAVGIAITVLVVGGLGVAVISRSAEVSLKAQIEDANRRQADRLAAVLEREVAAGVEPKHVLETLQRSLEVGPSDEAGYVCVMDADDAILCRAAGVEDAAAGGGTIVHRSAV